jgi:hypothetical protein
MNLVQQQRSDALHRTRFDETGGTRLSH